MHDFAPLFCSAGRSALRMRLLCLLLVALALLVSDRGARAQSGLTPVGASVHALSTLAFSGVMNGRPVADGYWYANGTGDVGYMDAGGIYHAPAVPPTPSGVTIGYYAGGHTVETTVTVTNPVPVPISLNVATIYQLSTPVVIFGSSFMPGATVLVNGVSTPTNYYGPGQLGLTVTFAKPVSGLITLTVQNPAPGSSSATITVPAAFSSSGVTPLNPQVHAAGTVQLGVQIAGVPQTQGYWYVNGTGDVGYIDGSAVYHAPLMVPTPNTATIGYYENGSSMTTTVTVTNPVPKVTSASVSVLSQMTTPVLLQGSGFLPTSVIYAQGNAMLTTYYSPNSIGAKVTLTTATRSGVTVTVKNPSPGASSGSILVPTSFPYLGSISPAKLPTGLISLQVKGSGFDANTRVLRDGRPLVVTLNSATLITAAGYMPPWGTSATSTITVVPATGSVVTGSKTLPIVYLATAYDAAARFSTQAAFGPRPLLVEHIQQVGLQGFLKEQMAVAGPTYPVGVLPRFPFMEMASDGNALLRLRVALALESFIDNQALTEEFESFAPWEQTVEADAFGNFRQLMTDIASNPRMGDFLNVPGNDATMGSSHPNQNFARELMQLFTIGTSMLNDDGTVKTDSSGRPIPAYDQNTIGDMARVFTGWNFAPTVNAKYVAFNIDWSQPLLGQDQYHDHGAKTLFGTVNLPMGQDIVTDRTAALDAVFNHPNVPAFVGTRLIEQLVKSNPTPAYVQRISKVFEDNGKGVRGDLSAVVQAILLDPEARAGDTAAVTASDGFLQDPLLWEAFVMNALQQDVWDGQVIYLPGKLGQDWWHPVSVFSFYPALFQIPGTTTNSPQYALLNNVTQLHRSQYLYGILTGQTSGFSTAFQSSSWLYTGFFTLPDLVDALNHQLFHGQMPAATQAAILNYCSGVSNQNQAFTDAIFLALNSDSFNVVH